MDNRERWLHTIVSERDEPRRGSSPLADVDADAASLEDVHAPSRMEVDSSAERQTIILNEHRAAEPAALQRSAWLVYRDVNSDAAAWRTPYIWLEISVGTNRKLT